MDFVYLLTGVLLLRLIVSILCKIFCTPIQPKDIKSKSESGRFLDIKPVYKFDLEKFLGIFFAQNPKRPQVIVSIHRDSEIIPIGCSSRREKLVPRCISKGFYQETFRVLDSTLTFWQAVDTFVNQKGTNTLNRGEGSHHRPKKMPKTLLTKKERFRVVITVDSLTDGSRVEKVPSLSDLIGCGKKRKAIWNKLIPRTNPFLAHNKRYFCATSFFNRQNQESKKSHEIPLIGIHMRTS